MTSILLIVEGEGDVRAAPILVRRVLNERHGRYDINVLRPQKRGDIHAIRKNISRFIKMAMLEKAPVLWLVDCDDGDWQVQQHDLEAALANEYLPYPVRFSLMVKEYEALFLAEPATTKKVLSISEEIEFPLDPENIRGAKEWLSSKMPKGYAYKETTHQEKLSASINLSLLAENSPNFRRFETNLIELIS